MTSIGASKVSLSHISTQELWKQTGRYSGNSELLHVKDRKGTRFLLAPTHEEEITALVANMVHSYKDLPLRLYQTGRKYRDERRPRQGLLRTKEFMMKDLYTFDASHDKALETYKDVCRAYVNLFNELKIPYLVADADSGNMGGKLSHEYHFVSEKGEDNVWSCSSCDYVANEELVEKKPPAGQGSNTSLDNTLQFRGITLDRKSVVNIIVPRPETMEPSHSKSPSWDDISTYVNLHAVKRAVPSLDTGIEAKTLHDLLSELSSSAPERLVHDQSLAAVDGDSIGDITPTQPGAPCPRCPTGHLSVQKAIEVGHTFHLGTRYSDPLSALVAVPDAKEQQAIHMGCHGIGVSRLIGSIASLLSDAQGLNWPRAVAPFEAIFMMTPQVAEADATALYDALRSKGVDAVLDDREKRLGWKLQDADLIGYPVILVLGKTWRQSAAVEVQCRRLGVKKVVPGDALADEVEALLAQL